MFHEYFFFFYLILDNGKDDKQNYYCIICSLIICVCFWLCSLEKVLRLQIHYYFVWLNPIDLTIAQDLSFFFSWQRLYLNKIFVLVWFNWHFIIFVFTIKMKLWKNYQKPLLILLLNQVIFLIFEVIFQNSSVHCFFWLFLEFWTNLLMFLIGCFISY